MSTADRSSRCAALVRIRSIAMASSFFLFFDCQFFLFGSFISQAPVDKTPSESLPPLSVSAAHWQALESRCDASLDFDINHSRNRSPSSSPDEPDSCPAKKSRLRRHDIVSEGAHVNGDIRQPETVGIQGCGVSWLRRWHRFATKIASPTLAGVLMFPNHLSIRRDSPCH